MIEIGGPSLNNLISGEPIFQVQGKISAASGRDPCILVAIFPSTVSNELSWVVGYTIK
jgi:hypothetical protein